MRSSGDLILFLNNDVTVTKDTIERLVAKALSDPQIGILGPKICFGSMPDILQYAGGILMPNGNAILIGFLEKDRGQYDKFQDTDFVHGAAFMVRRSLFDRIGSFDTLYFPIYHDEVDLCFRAKKHGFRVVYVAEAVVFHHERMDQTKVIKTAYLRNRNRLIFALKNLPLSNVILLPIHDFLMIFKELFKSGSKYKKMINSTKYCEMFRQFIKAYMWVLKNLRTILHARKSHERRN
jgi:hypothetical protein